jgi:hypothetical protein
LKSSGMKAALALDRIAEQEEVGARRQVNIRAAMGLYGAVDDAEAHAFLWRSPGAEGNTAATPKHSECLAQESIRVRKMWDPEVADHGIEDGVWEEERASVTFAELDVWIVLPSERELRGREINSNRDGAPLGCCRCGVTCSCGNVQNPRSPPDLGSIKEWADHLSGHR